MDTEIGMDVDDVAVGSESIGTIGTGTTGVDIFVEGSAFHKFDIFFLIPRVRFWFR